MAGLGGGFIGQMYQTNKQNRDWLKTVVRKPFEFGLYNKDERKRAVSIYHLELTEDDKKYWKKVASKQRARDRNKGVVILITSIFIVAILYFVFYAEWAAYVRSINSY